MRRLMAILTIVLCVVGLATVLGGVLGMLIRGDW
jgi:hypothetical protein